MADDSSRPRPFRGFYRPYTTPVPDNFFDEVMPDLSGTEVKVLLYIFRRTFGFKKNSDSISLSQLVHGITRRDGTVLDRGTGLGKSSVARSLNQLVEKGMLRKTRQRTSADGDQPTTYEPVLADPAPVSQPGTGGVPEWDRPVSHSGTHKKQRDKKQSDNTVNGSKSPLTQLPDLDIEPERQQLLMNDIIAQLGDPQSERFYRLVAIKVPESVVRQTLSQLKSDGARQPASLFTYRMQRWALDRLAEQFT